MFIWLSSLQSYNFACVFVFFLNVKLTNFMHLPNVFTQMHSLSLITKIFWFSSTSDCIRSWHGNTSFVEYNGLELVSMTLHNVKTSKFFNFICYGLLVASVFCFCLKQHSWTNIQFFIHSEFYDEKTSLWKELSEFHLNKRKM